MVIIIIIIIIIIISFTVNYIMRLFTTGFGNRSI